MAILSNSQTKKQKNDKIFPPRFEFIKNSKTTFFLHLFTENPQNIISCNPKNFKSETDLFEYLHTKFDFSLDKKIIGFQTMPGLGPFITFEHLKKNVKIITDFIRVVLSNGLWHTWWICLPSRKHGFFGCLGILF